MFMYLKMAKWRGFYNRKSLKVSALGGRLLVGSDTVIGDRVR